MLGKTSNLVGNGSNTQVVLLNVRTWIDKTPQESVSKTAVPVGINYTISEL